MRVCCANPTSELMLKHECHTTKPKKMNIFILSKNAKRAARFHCDKHVIKMILESIQLLTCAWYSFGLPGWEAEISAKVAEHPVTKMHGDDAKTTVYKRTHANHPCSLWVQKSAANYAWLVDMTRELCLEKRRRWPKTLPHKCEAYLDALQTPPPLLKDVGQTPFAVAISSTEIRAKRPRCTEDELECIEAYRDYYAFDKPFASWKCDDAPDWFQERKKQMPSLVA